MLRAVTWLLTIALLAPAELLGGEAGFEAHAAALAADGGPEAALRLAQGYGARGRLEEALRWAKRAAEGGAHPLRVHIVRGDAYLRAQRFEFAIREFYEVVTGAPDNGYAQVSLWRCFRQADVLPDMLDAARLRAELRKGGLYLPEAPARPPNVSLGAQLRDAGVAALRAGRFREAVEKLQAALAQNDHDEKAYLALAKAHERLGQQRLAVGAYRLFVELAPRETRDTRDAHRLMEREERRRGLAAPR